jgi:quinol monooxygenase YgiN
VSNVISLMPENATANEVLDECKDEFEQLLVIGWSEEGLMSAKSTASLDIKEIIYMIEVFKSVIITTGHEVE